MVLCAVPGSDGAGPLVQLMLVSQAGGPRGRLYFPYIAFRVTRPLQACPVLYFISGQTYVVLSVCKVMAFSFICPCRRIVH